jgi:hypothetical protein
MNIILNIFKVFYCIASIIPTFAYTVEYHDSYKIVTTGDTNMTLYRDVVPNIYTDKYIQIPLRSFGTTSTVMLPFVEILNVTNSLDYFGGGIEYVSSSCVTTQLLTGVDGIPSISRRDGSNTYIFADVWDTVPNDYHTIPYLESQETTVFGKLRYLHYMSLFFDLEETATEFISKVEDIYSHSIGSNIPNSLNQTVLWTYWVGEFGGPDVWSIGNCPSYYCQYITEVGGRLLTPENLTLSVQTPYPTYNYTEWYKLAKLADVIIFTGNTIYPVNSENLTSRMYDLSKRGPGDWFEWRYGRPDLVLRDFIWILSNESLYQPTWFRHVSSEGGNKPNECGLFSFDNELTAEINILNKSGDSKSNPTLTVTLLLSLISIVYSTYFR